MVLLYKAGNAVLVMGHETLQALYIGISPSSPKALPLPVSDAAVLVPHLPDVKDGLGFTFVQNASRVDHRSASWRRILAAVNKLIPGASRNYSLYTPSRLVYDGRRKLFVAKTLLGEMQFPAVVNKQQ